jgi:heat-inducible transcriptional repressor
MPRPITNRQREILNAIIESYIATGEPVSSGALAQTAFAKTMSSATIRNEMAELADAGLLDQPHTSAGRVPSPEAFRLYVASLTGRQAAGTAQTALQTQIDTSFAGVAGASAMLERTSHVLAALSSGVGLAIGAAASNDLLEHIHFSRLAPQRILAVVVTRSGMVRDRVLALEYDLVSVQLETAANFLNEHFRGWNIDRVRAELARRVEQERSAYRELNNAVELWSRAVPSDTTQQQTVYIDGVANLLTLAEDRARLRAMLAALEEKQRLIELLGAYIDARQESVRVVFDLDQQDPGMAGLVLVAAPARFGVEEGGGALGTVAILGPQRMHYQNAIDAVGYIARLLERGALGAPETETQ